MKASPKFKIIVIGSALIVLVIALRFLTQFEHSPTPLILGNGLLEGAGDSAAVMRTHPAPSRVLKQSNQDKPMIDPSRVEHTVTVNYDLRTDREAQLISNMNYALTNSTDPIVVEQRILRKLVMARIKADWSTVPKGPDWADAPEWQRHSADMLKRNIGYLIPSGTNIVDGREELIPATPDIIERVIKANVGTEVPPMEDYEVHD